MESIAYVHRLALSLERQPRKVGYNGTRVQVAAQILPLLCNDVTLHVRVPSQSPKLQKQKSSAMVVDHDEVENSTIGRYIQFKK